MESLYVLSLPTFVVLAIGVALYIRKLFRKPETDTLYSLREEPKQSIIKQEVETIANMPIIKGASSIEDWVQSWADKFDSIKG